MRRRSAAHLPWWRRAPRAGGKIYLIDPGNRILVLGYTLGDESNHPADVTKATLTQIINSVGLP